jgi:hypothetical protein
MPRQGRRRTATSPGCRRAACTPVAQVRRRYFRVPGLSGITRLAQRAPPGPVPAPAARGPLPRPPARGGMRGAGESTTSISCTCPPPVQSPGGPSRRPRPLSVAATAGMRTGDARGAEGAASGMCAKPLGDAYDLPRASRARCRRPVPAPAAVARRRAAGARMGVRTARRRPVRGVYGALGGGGLARVALAADSRYPMRH